MVHFEYHRMERSSVTGLFLETTHRIAIGNLQFKKSSKRQVDAF